MEKIIYVLRRDPAVDIETYAHRLRTVLPGRLRAPGVRGLQVNVADAAVAPAAALRQTATTPPIEALLGVWVDSSVAALRKPVDDTIAEFSPSFWAYLVTESVPLRNTRHPPQPGERTFGMAQVAFLRLPQKLGYDAWLDIWQNSQTRIAIETQATFEYIQNAVVRRLTPDSPPFVAIVEECFPEAAMTDYQAYFDAPGDEAKFKRNLARMMENVARFIDPGTIDVVPTSQYVILPPMP